MKGSEREESESDVDDAMSEESGESEESEQSGGSDDMEGDEGSQGSEEDSEDGDSDGEGREGELMEDPATVRERLDEALALLKVRGKGRAQNRSEVIAKLSRDLSEYFGYNEELTELFLEIFSPDECVEYFDASDKPRPLVIRTNTLKTTRKSLMEALTQRGVTLEAIDWSKVAIKVTASSVPVGATPEYLAGHYMLQAAASLNPVMALAPLPGERCLDMSSAPGGKTAYMAQLMKNAGMVVANDLKAERQKATIANLHRLGCKNVVYSSADGRKLPSGMRGFDRVLLDAPCSGMGVISRDQSVKTQRTVKDIERMAHLQKELLVAAVDACNPKSKTGGFVVYSTCSVTVQENEAVVDYVLSKRHVKLVDSGLTVGRKGFPRSFSLSLSLSFFLFFFFSSFFLLQEGEEVCVSAAAPSPTNLF
jgi:ribosomal RNA methyltransferase Nop2